MVCPGGLYWQATAQSYITSQVSLFDITFGVGMLTYFKMSIAQFLKHHFGYYTSLTNTGKLN